MTSILHFLLGATLVLPELVKKRGDVDFNLEDVVLDFLENYKEENDLSLWDFDITGKNPECPWVQYIKNPVEAIFGEVQLLSTETRSMKPVVAYTQLFHNGQPDRSQTTTVEKETTRTNTESFTVERGITIGTRGEFKVNPLDFVSVSSSISLTFGATHGTTNVKAKTVTRKIKQRVNIPPESSVRVDWIINEEIVDVPWQADVDLTGHFAGEFELKSGEKFWKFFHVKELSHPDLVKYTGSDKVYFQARGFYKIIRAGSDRVVTRETIHNPYNPYIKSKPKKKTKKT